MKVFIYSLIKFISHVITEILTILKHTKICYRSVTDKNSNNTPYVHAKVIRNNYIDVELRIF